MIRKCLITVYLAIALLCVKVEAASVPTDSNSNYTGRYYDINVNGQMLETDVLAVVLENRSLVPVRAVFEKLGATVIWYDNTKEVCVSLKNNKVVLKIDDKTAVVNGKKVVMDVAATVINGRTMVPLRFVGEQLGCEVCWLPDELSVSVFDKPVNITKVLYEHGKDKSKVIIKADGKIKNYLISYANNPTRLIIDIPASKFNLEQRIIEVRQGPVERIRLSQFKIQPSVTRAVIDLSEWAAYKVDYSDDYKQIVVEFIYKSSNLKDVSFLRKADSENVVIKLDLLHGHIVSKLSNPSRLVIDLPETAVGKTSGYLETSGKFVKKVRYAQFNETTARVVADLAGEPQYEILQNDNTITVKLFESPFKNIRYFNNGKQVYFEIENCNLEGKYSRNVDIDAKTCTVAFPATEVDIAAGVMNINDSKLYYVDIEVDKTTNTAKMIFKCKNVYNVDIEADEKNNKTKIVLTGLDIDGEKLVVIDPGHGGTEPGAIYKDILEKDLNLDICLRLNSLLKSKNVKTYMLREKDVAVDIYERPEIANKLNAALYLSVHNNALPGDASYSGTMTLYYPDGVDKHNMTSKRFAEIVHRKLLNALNTTDRKIISRPNLVVLKYTKMPAVLAEIAFLTNKTDRENLLKESFRQKAAQALCDAVVQALTEMKH